MEQSTEFVAEQKNLLSQITQEKTEAQIKLSALDKQVFQDQSEQNYRQFSGLFAVQSVLENKDKFGTVHGLVAELGEVEEKFRLALEVSAGSYLSALVVADEEVARLGIEFLRNNRLGVATFLPLSKIRPRFADQELSSVLSLPGVVGLATDNVKYDSKFSNIFSFVFGQTVVVEDLVVAKKIGVGRVRMVTLAGDMVEKNGVMKGGFKQIKKDALGFSTRLRWKGDNLAESQAQISLAKQKITDLDADYEKIKIKLLEFESKKEITGSKFNLLQEEIKRVGQEKGGLEHELALYNSDPKEIGLLLSGLAEEKERLLAQIETKAKEAQEYSQKIDSFNKDEEAKKQKVFALQDAMQKKQNLLNEILSKRNDLKIEVAKLETKQEALTEEVRIELVL
jgi:chromosome segregation protein